MFNLTAGLQGLQQIGDRFTQLRDELELSIEETIRAERVDGLPGEGEESNKEGTRRQRRAVAAGGGGWRRVAAGGGGLEQECACCA